MKVQTTVLLCFLSGVFLSAVVHAKPSPALMKELIALEKYLEKKQGSDSADGQNKNQDDKSGDSLLNNEDPENGNPNLRPIEENQPTENGQNNPTKENNDNVGDAEAPQENEKPNEAVRPIKPEEGVPPENLEEGAPTPNPEEGVTSENAEEGEKPQEGNGLSPSEGQVENEKDQILLSLDEVKETFKDAIDILGKLYEDIRKQFDIDDQKFAELEDKDRGRIDKTKQIFSKLKTVVEEIKSVLGLKDTPSSEKTLVQENAPARRSHISDTEFLNIVHSLLTNN